MKRPKILIIKIDGIGDYILFRNFIQDLKTHFLDHEITLLGNVLWKDIAIKYDHKYVDKFIWIDVDRFSSSRLYRNLFFFILQKKYYDYVICPTFSRRFFFEDDLVKKSKAKIKVGFDGDLSNRSKEQKVIGDKFYDVLYSVECEFEFFKNKSLIEKITNQDSKVQNTYFNGANNEKNGNIIIFPGGSEAHKRWSPIKFANLIIHLLNSGNKNILICGSKKDKHLAEEICKVANLHYINNLTGKTTLVELIEIINDARILITNDTATAHIGPSVNTDTICLYKGDHFGRFQPYPPKFNKSSYVIMPEKIGNPKTNTISKISINSIDVQEVLKLVFLLLEKG